MNNKWSNFQKTPISWRMDDVPATKRIGGISRNDIS